MDESVSHMLCELEELSESGRNHTESVGLMKMASEYREECVFCKRRKVRKISLARNVGQKLVSCFVIFFVLHFL